MGTITYQNRLNSTSRVVSLTNRTEDRELLKRELIITCTFKYSFSFFRSPVMHKRVFSWSIGQQVKNIFICIQDFVCLLVES